MPYADKTKQSEYLHRWRQDNAGYSTAYWHKHKMQLQIRYKRWVKNNKTRWYQLQSKRRCLERTAQGNHTAFEWNELKTRYHNRCPSCLRLEPEIRLQRDHIIPLSKGGTNDISNIQPLCINCNSHKHTTVKKY